MTTNGASWNEQVPVLFLRALLATRKSLNLYPDGSEMATAWIERLHRSLPEFLRRGLTFPLRVGSDRFSWAGEDLLTLDPALEAFRFDLEARGIAAFAIDPAVAEWELRAFLDLLNQPAERLESVSGAAAFLRARGVMHVSVSAPAGAEARGPATEANRLALEAGRDPVDLFVDAVLEMVEERLAQLTYDRQGLTDWLAAVSAGEHVDRLYAAIKMLGALADGAGDREVRMRTVLEALLRLPEPTLQPLLTKWLVPLAGSDLVAFNLLTQVTEDELGEIARLVPEEQLLSLTTELIEFPWEEGKRQRLLEAITWTLRRRDEPPGPGLEPPLRMRDDPLLAEIRSELLEACHPDAILDRSADVLLALLFDVEHEEYPAFAMDALEELVGEALARTKIDLAVRVLSTLGTAPEREGDALRQHSRRLGLLRSRTASRTHVSLVAGLLRQAPGPEQVELAAGYLRLVAREGAREFADLLADERERRVRARMCQVLARVGPAVLPILLPRLEDRRWYVARNVLYIVGRIGHESALPSVVAALDHAHPRVRIEAVRALGLIGGVAAMAPLLGCLADPDRSVRRAVAKWLGHLGDEQAVAALRDLASSPVEVAEDWEVRQDALRAMAAIGTPFAQSVLAGMATRRVWIWRRGDRRLRALARDALRGQAGLPRGVGGDDER